MYVHRGQVIQRGYGLGSLFRGIVRALVPIGKTAVKSIIKSPRLKKVVRSTARVIKKTAMKEGRGLATDLLRGRDLKTATPKRFSNTVRKVAGSLAKQLDLVKPRKKVKKRTVKRLKVVKSRRTKGRRSIFD